MKEVQSGSFQLGAQAVLRPVLKVASVRTLSIASVREAIQCPISVRNLVGRSICSIFRTSGTTWQHAVHCHAHRVHEKMHLYLLS